MGIFDDYNADQMDDNQLLAIIGLRGMRPGRDDEMNGSMEELYRQRDLAKTDEEYARIEKIIGERMWRSYELSDAYRTSGMYNMELDRLERRIDDSEDEKMIEIFRQEITELKIRYNKAIDVFEKYDQPMNCKKVEI